jgi:hypothetical protein
MTRDELRFEELVSRKHLWPEEVRQLEMLAETLGKEVTIVRQKLEEWLEVAHAGTA